MLHKNPQAVRFPLAPPIGGAAATISKNVPTDPRLNIRFISWDSDSKLHQKMENSLYGKSFPTSPHRPPWLWLSHHYWDTITSPVHARSDASWAVRALYTWHHRPPCMWPIGVVFGFCYGCTRPAFARRHLWCSLILSHWLNSKAFGFPYRLSQVIVDL